MTFEATLQKRIEIAKAENDPAALDELLDELYKKAAHSPKPFEAAIELKAGARRKLADTALEGDALVNWANQISRAKRLVDYRLITAFGFDGLKIVDEGDSWHQYPLLLEDIVDHLSKHDDKAIFSLSAGGDLVEDMAARAEYSGALAETGAPVMILSGGGNDLLGDGRFKSVLLPYQPGRDPIDLIDLPTLAHHESRVLEAYVQILSDVRSDFPNVRVFGHGYDLPYPREGGAWIGGPLQQRGIPLHIGREILQIVFDRFSESLLALQDQFENYTLVDLRGVVDRGPQSWFDELHPKDAGYKRAADRIADAIQDAASSGGFEMATRGITVPGAVFEAAASTIVLDPGHGGSTPPAKVGGSSWNNAVGPRGTLEKTLTLDVAKRAKAILEERGHSVVLTRETDRNLSLRDRASVAKDINAAAFVSIHFNGSRMHNAQGTETFVHPQHSQASRDLCVAVQAAMVAELGLRDRNASHPGGVKVGSYGVLRRDRHAPGTAAVLHEVSFLDRAVEEARLLTTSYRDRIAMALADGIEAYLGGGFEAFNLSGESGEIGDAIEAGAFELGVSVNSFLGFAEMPCTFEKDAYGSTSLVPAEPIGGHALAPTVPGLDYPVEHPGPLSENLAGQIVASLHGGHIDGEANDINEFANIHVGEGFVIPAPGDAFESGVASINHAFANLSAGGFDLARFEAFIKGLGLRWFQPAEFLYPGASNASGPCAGKNTPPPEHLWPNIADTALMLDEIREQLGVAVRITSCYRSPAYNDCIGGGSASLHMRFNAVDWTAASGSVSDWHATAVAVRASDPRFRGGIGKYTSNRFIHIDTRGNNTDW